MHSQLGARGGTPLTDVMGYRGLIIGEAQKVWNRLPKQTQAWIGLEDLIEQGMYFAWRQQGMWYQLHSGRYVFQRKIYWDSMKAASFGTYLRNHLPKFYDTKVIGPYQTAAGRCLKERMPDGTYKELPPSSIQTMQEAHGREGGTWAFEAHMVNRPEQPQLDCIIVDGITQVYDKASPSLKSQMLCWFLESDKHKFHTRGRKFTNYCSEFRQLAAVHRVTIDDCRHLIRSPECLDLFSRKARWIPYNLNDPTPGVVANPYVVQPRVAAAGAC